MDASPVATDHVDSRASKLKQWSAAASPFPRGYRHIAPGNQNLDGRGIQIFRARIAALRDSIQPASGIPFEANFARSSPRARASAFSRTGIESVGRFLAGLLLNLRGNQDLGQNVLTKKLGLVTELFSMAFALCCLLVLSIYLWPQNLINL